MIDLKPCPWCGTTGTLFISVPKFDGDDEACRYAFAVVCDQCWSHGPVSAKKVVAEAREDVVDKWNQMKGR